MNKLMGYSFPGNIRELRNLLERAHILAQGPEIEDLPINLEFINDSGVGADVVSWISSLPSNVDVREVLAEVERSLLQRALERANGVQAEAARMLNLSRSDFGYKAAKYSLGR